MASRSALLISLLILLTFRRVSGVPLEDLYPFNKSEAGDMELFRNDDSSSNGIDLTVSFPFFEENHDTVFINNNGVISFTTTVPEFTPEPFPLEGDLELIAPFWADVDTRGTGTVWYRETASQELLERAANEIHNGFVDQGNFFPSYLIIATWDHVGYFREKVDKTNTFQCVLATDGLTSFVIFLYADGEIQWTTGDASGGTDGLGGKPAQVGFNAGDGIKSASLPESQTGAIINVTMTSNVDIPGVYIFQVDEEEITEGGCVSKPVDEIPLAISPRYGNILGGDTIRVGGPCFNENDEIMCVFDGISVIGIYLNKFEVLCVSPLLSVEGRIQLELYINEFLVGRATFTSLSVTRGHQVDVLNDDFLFSSGDNLHLRWDVESIFPPLNSSMYSVDVILYEYDVNSETWKELSGWTNIDNSGETDVVLGSYSISGDAVPIAIQILVTHSIGTTDLHQSLIAANLRAGKWTAQFYYGQQQLDFRGFILCGAWYSLEPADIGEQLLDRVPPCPPTETQAMLPNSGVEPEIYTSFFGNTLYRSQRMNFFHPHTAICYKQQIGTSLTEGSSQQCCYDTSGNLVVGSPNGGTVQSISEETSFSQHFVSDTLQFILCCKTAFPQCGKYYEKRPSDDGSEFNPPPPAWMFGDPHLVTPDGLKYTFNGKGEYILIETTDNSFTLQGRMVEATGASGTPVQATVFSALACKQSDSDTVQLELSRRGIDALVNGERVRLEELPQQDFRNVSVVDLGNNTISATFSSGASVFIQLENGILSALGVSLPPSYQDKTAGLLGSYNGDSSDDLLPRFGAADPLPVNSTVQEIHQSFGTSWLTRNSSESIFTYRIGESWQSIHDSGNSFVPLYEPVFLNATLENETRELCGKDQFCLFDVAVTGRMEIGLSTLKANENVDLVVQLSLPIVCDPLCVNGACVASNTCNCGQGFTGTDCSERVYTACEASICENGGTCRAHAGTYSCTCPSGYTGTMCETAVYTVCEENLCDNGGTCLAHADAYNCTCLSGYTGTLCETSLDACNERVCENGGTCMADAGTFSCTCPSGYTGAICETTLDVSDAESDDSDYSLWIIIGATIGGLIVLVLPIVIVIIVIILTKERRKNGHENHQKGMLVNGRIQNNNSQTGRSQNSHNQTKNGPYPTGHSQNGPYLTGHSQNGPFLTGHSQNGPFLTGHSQKDHSLNSHRQNGHVGGFDFYSENSQSRGTKVYIDNPVFGMTNETANNWKYTSV